MSLHSFTFNSVASSTYGIYIKDKMVYGAPARSVSAITIPGRSGDLLIDNGRFENFRGWYDCYFIPNNTYTTLQSLSRAVKAWLNPSVNYYTLTDTYNPEYFRKAAFSSQLDFVETLLKVGSTKIAFNCKPFLYLTTGQSTLELTAAGTITNPESIASLPYIKITGSGNVTLSINAKSYALTTIGPNIEIDSEIMNVYRGTTSLNSKMTSDGFPVLEPGANTISWTGTVSKVEIIPRWCTL